MQGTFQVQIRFETDCGSRFAFKWVFDDAYTFRIIGVCFDDLNCTKIDLWMRLDLIATKIVFVFYVGICLKKKLLIDVFLVMLNVRETNVECKNVGENSPHI